MPVAIIDSLSRGASGAGNFPVAKQDDLKLGYLNVADLPARNAIPVWQRVPFMTVYVQSTNLEYTLGADLTIAGQVWTPKTYGVPSNVVTEDELFGVDGLIKPQLIGNIFLNSSYVVGSQAAMLALTTFTGNIIVRTDTSNVYVKLNNTNPAAIGDFALASGSGSVLSVNGQTGVVNVTIANLLANGTNNTNFQNAVNSNATVASHTASISTLTTNLSTTNTNLSNLTTYVDNYIGSRPVTALLKAPTGAQTGYAIRWNGSAYDLQAVTTGSSLPFLDNTVLLQNNLDTSKQARFDLGSISTSTTRVYTLPDFSGILIGTNNSGIVNLPTSTTFASVRPFSTLTDVDLLLSPKNRGQLGLSTVDIASGVSGTVTIEVGAASGTATGVGLLYITGGFSSVSGVNGGSVVITGGDAGNGNTNGGNVSISGGIFSGTGTQGTININGATTFQVNNTTVANYTSTLFNSNIKFRTNGSATLAPLLIGQLSVAPSTPSIGDIYLHSVDRTLRYYTGTSWFILNSSPAGGSGTPVYFTSLADVPNSYSGQALKTLRVNAAETALEYVTASSGTVNSGTANQLAVYPSTGNTVGGSTLQYTNTSNQNLLTFPTTTSNGFSVANFVNDAGVAVQFGVLGSGYSGGGSIGTGGSYIYSSGPLKFASNGSFINFGVGAGYPEIARLTATGFGTTTTNSFALIHNSSNRINFINTPTSANGISTRFDLPAQTNAVATGSNAGYTFSIGANSGAFGTRPGFWYNGNGALNNFTPANSLLNDPDVTFQLRAIQYASGAIPATTPVAGFFITRPTYSSVAAGQTATVNHSTVIIEGEPISTPSYNIPSANAYSLTTNGKVWLNGLRFGTSATAGHVLTIASDGTVTPQAPSGGGITRTVINQSTNVTAGATAGVDYFYDCTGTFSLMLPTAVGNTNKYTIKNSGTGVITINTTSFQLIDANLTAVLSTQWYSICLISNGTNWRVV